MNETRKATQFYQGYVNTANCERVLPMSKFLSEFAFRFHFNGKRDWGNCIDFGGSAGYKTAMLKDVLVVEIDESARKMMKQRGIRCAARIDSVKDGSVDTLYCAHVLEHLESPSEYLKLFHRKLKKDGILIIVLPLELQFTWSPSELDPNGHLYAWIPVNIHTLLHRMGYSVSTSKCTTLPALARVIGLKAYAALIDFSPSRIVLLIIKTILVLLLPSKYRVIGELVVTAKKLK